MIDVFAVSLSFIDRILWHCAPFTMEQSFRRITVCKGILQVFSLDTWLLPEDHTVTSFTRLAALGTRLGRYTN